MGATEFRSMHRSLTIFLVYLMQSNNLLWQKNAILVLYELQNAYPRVLSHAKHLKSKVSAIQEKQEKGTSMAILCERVIAILEKGINTKLYLDEQKFGGRNLGPTQNKNSKEMAYKKKQIESEQDANKKADELRRKALESMKGSKESKSKITGRKRSHSEMDKASNSNGSPSVNAKKKLRIDTSTNGNVDDRDRPRKSQKSTHNLTSSSSKSSSKDSRQRR